MQKYSKMLALLLAILLMVMPGTGMVSAATTVTVTTGDGAALDGEISHLETDINVTFGSDVTESTLANNVKLDTVSEKGNVIRMKAARSDTYCEWFYYYPAETITSGIVEISFSAMQHVDTAFASNRESYPLVRFQATRPNSKMGTLDGVGFTEGTLFYGNTTNTNTDMSDIYGRWVDMKAVLYLDGMSAEDTTPKYEIYVDGVLEGTSLFKNSTYTTATDPTPAAVERIAFGASESAAALDISYKDIVIKHTASEGATPTVFDTDISNAEVGTMPAFFTKHASMTASCAVENTYVDNEAVAVTRSYVAATKTYTLTNEGEWNQTKKYLLTVGTGVLDAANTAVTDTALTYEFVARNQGGTPGITSVTTDDGAELGAEVDLLQKDISIGFGTDMSEASLNENITLAAVERGNILRMKKDDATTYWGGHFYWTPADVITAGTVTMNFSAKYKDTGLAAAVSECFPLVRFWAEDASASTGYAMHEGIGFTKDATFRSSTTQPGTITDTSDGRWVDVQIVVDVANRTYTLYVDGNLEAENVTFVNTRPANIGRISFGANEKDAALDVSYKDISIVHTASEGAAPYTYDTDFSDAAVGTRPACFTYGNDLTNGNIDFGVEYTLLESETVPTLRTYDADSKTYTVTASGDWSTAKNYELTISKALKDTSGADVLAADRIYSFVARNLSGGVFTLDSITNTNGGALTEGGFMPVSARGINLGFSDALLNTDENYAGITLKKKDVERVLTTTLYNGTADYGRNLLKLDMTSLSTPKDAGTYTFTGSIIVDTENYDAFDASGASTNANTSNTPYFEFGGTGTTNTIIASVKPEAVRLNYSKYVSGTNNTNPQDKGVNNLPKSEWRDFTFTINLDTDTYSFTLTDPATGTPKTYPDNAKIYPGSSLSSLCFGIYTYTTSTSEASVSWKDLKLTYAGTDGEGNPVSATVFDIATDTADLTNDVFGTFTSFYGKNGVKKGETYFDNEYEMPTVELEYETAYNPTTKTLAILPKVAFEYLSNYTLTVPTSVLSAEGTALNAETVLTFKAVYTDNLYSGVSGFKANNANLTEIASTFTGDITGWAEITNITSGIQDATVIVALYKGGKLVDVDITEVAGIGAGSTVTASGTVTVAADAAGTGYQAAVYVWDDMDTICPVTVKTTTK